MSSDPELRKPASRPGSGLDSEAGPPEPERAYIATEWAARHEATRELARTRAWVQALDRLSALSLASGEPGDFLNELVKLLCEVGRSDVAALRVLDGEVYRSRACSGVDAEAEAVFSHGPDLGGHGTYLEAIGADDARVGAALRATGARRFYALSCRDGDTRTASVCLGWTSAAPPPEHGLYALERIAPRVAAAITQRLAVESLEQAVRSRDQVLAVVAHDLRNPISVISMAANNMLKKVSDSLARRPIERIIRASQRADHLIDDLLQIDAIEGGRFTIQPRRVDAADVILAALESQQGLAASASVILATDLSPRLPAVEGDAERLLEVLENLIGNAIKFTSPGGSVTVGANARQNEIAVWVKDSGSGIPAEQLPHLFDRFWQARKVDRRGTGLGLTICKAIVEAHGGQIWAESKPGVGTTMSFTIPALASDRPVAADVQKAGILVVDDRPENLLSLSAILDRPDYRVVCAKSGQEALSHALREQFCVALIDIAMPGMNGLEVAVHLKELERSRDIPIIFITAFGDDPQEIHRAYSAGGVDYLVKPLDTEIVRKKVAVFVDLSKRRRASDPPR